MKEKKVSFNSVFTVVEVAKEKVGARGKHARKYLNDIKDNLTDSARLLVNGAMPKKVEKTSRNPGNSC